MNLRTGAAAEVTITVQSSMTAATFARDAGELYPEVLATPFMIGEMERAAAALMRPFLKPGELSVGTAVDIAHLAPTPVGAALTSHARYLLQDGSVFWFEVWAEDDGGIVGRGRHGRAIVAAETIEPRAVRRLGKRRTASPNSCGS